MTISALVGTTLCSVILLQLAFVDHLCYLCLVFVMLSCLFIATLWSAEGKGLTYWLLFVMIIVISFTFPFGILGQVWYLDVSIPDPCCLSYF